MHTDWKTKADTNFTNVHEFGISSSCQLVKFVSLIRVHLCPSVVGNLSVQSLLRARSDAPHLFRRAQRFGNVSLHTFPKGIKQKPHPVTKSHEAQ